MILTAPATPCQAFKPAANPTNVFMIDLETAGTSWGSAILEIAAAEFDPHSGAIYREWSTPVDILDCVRHGLTSDADTASFHLRNAYQADLRGASLWRALSSLETFLHLVSEPIEVWAWGLDFESLILKSACQAVNFPLPWHFSEGRCARTAWSMAFPGRKPKPRPHRAADDVRHQIGDLCQALAALRP